MRELIWSPAFTRELKRLVRQNPPIREVTIQTLQKLTDDPFQATLRTHKLKGELEEKWSCSIDYSYRIVLKFVENSN